VTAIAKEAIARHTGARGLRSIVEALLMDIMYDLPNSSSKQKVVVTRDTVEKKSPPEIEELKKSA
ncbi:MAG: ATP-dependent Clp protease ATP-binding subunit ClpX, partial [Spirochaetia bacterium]|nr:ATP-dependent Clp protease ATP-binding subunit ClpX [Spirochaetia bacterium]